MRRPRRNHSARFKAKVALSALKGDKTLAELSEQFDLHANQITDWKNRLLQQSEDVFLSKAEKQAQQLGPTTQEMKAKIGELSLEVDFLERALGRLDDPSARR
tara:strand:+ start:51 stop:359 length:309 start_codon:yes stop_codon:yes gene_type:complete